MVGLNIIGNLFPETSLGWMDLLILSIVGGICFMLLSWYYNEICKKDKKVDFTNFGKPVFEFNDVLLQGKASSLTFLDDKSNSLLTKIVICILIILVITTPLIRLFGIQTIY